MNNFPVSLEVLIVLIFVAVIGHIAKKTNRFKIGKIASFGMLFILLPQAMNELNSLHFLIGVPCSFLGIILIMLDRENIKLNSEE